jgi:hypothetical protein
VTIIVAFSLTGCNLLNNTEKNNKNGIISSENDGSLNASATLNISEDMDSASLVINDIPIGEKDYILDKESNSSEIMLDSEVFKFTFKLADSSSIYPEFITENGKITTVWSDNGEPALKVDMIEGSKEASMNGKPIEIKTAPKTIDERLYIPISPFIDALKMKETYDEALKIKLIHCQEDFNKDLLQGNWSDSDSDLFKTFKDATAGTESLPSFAVGYQFNKDGSYRYIIIGADGFKDTLLQLEGKYKILGNTIIYYDILETIYEGNPLELVHKDLKREHPYFDFIGDCDSENSQIVIGDFFLNKVTP